MRSNDFLDQPHEPHPVEGWPAAYPGVLVDSLFFTMDHRWGTPKYPEFPLEMCCPTWQPPSHMELLKSILIINKIEISFAQPF